MPEEFRKTASDELMELVEKLTEVSEKGFAVDLSRETEHWVRLIRSLGDKTAYQLMSWTLEKLYEKRFGREYLFTDRCMAFEIEYHANAYFWTRGFRGFPRHVTTYLFSRKDLERHCEIINISTDDLMSRRQRLVFGYVRGVRTCYQDTENDPFDRSTFLKRAAGCRKRD